ncbi:hypothetical protein QQ045_029581 [Rhodiola kirilowii]
MDEPPMDELADHHPNVEPAAESSMDVGGFCSNPVPISQGFEVAVSDDEQSLSPEASFADPDNVHVDELVFEHCNPCCPEDQKPKIGMSFLSTELAVDFYRNYARLGDFDVRCGTTRKYKDGIVKKKYFYCNREGFPLTNSYNTSNGKRVRNCASQRCGCKASMVIEHRGSLGYVISEFIEYHNHRLATGRRKLSLLHQRFIVGLSKANTGPVKAHKIAKQLYGDYANVGAQDVEFRNFHRDVVQYIGDHDAQMVLDNFAEKKKLCRSYFYEYSVVDGAFSRIFWADPTSQLNFQAFGDVVTFDATYSLNRYKMIFVPFTGIDNHKNSITFAAALLSREDIESYTWLLNYFLKCMGRAPNIVLTDQDPSLREVVPKVMPDTHHRFCIWHIMRKLSSKVGFGTPRLQEFRSKMKALVYDYHIDTEDFEVKWVHLMAEYDMSGNKCENSSKKLLKRTPLSIEVDALKNYTRKVSQDVQSEIAASCFDVSIIKLLEHEEVVTYEIQDSRYNGTIFQVSHHQSSPNFVCTCHLFERIGILCRHVFAAFKSTGIVKIPAKYVLNRWTKTAIETAAQGADTCLVEDCQTIQQSVSAEQEIWTEFNACLNMAGNDIEKTEYIHHKLIEMLVHLQEVSAGDPVRCKSTIIWELIGASKPTELLVKAPAVVRTKGSGKRLHSEFEKAINKPERAPRMCTFCVTLGNHDSRNCPVKEQLKDPLSSAQ